MSFTFGSERQPIEEKKKCNEGSPLGKAESNYK